MAFLRMYVPLAPPPWHLYGGLTLPTSQMVFLIDLPRLDTGPSDGNVVPSSPFRDDLSAFLRALTVDEKLVKSLVHYDFSQTAGLRFVHSM